jgi:hypothetical protein
MEKIQEKNKVLIEVLSEAKIKSRRFLIRKELRRSQRRQYSETILSKIVNPINSYNNSDYDERITLKFQRLNMRY